MRIYKELLNSIINNCLKINKKPLKTLTKEDVQVESKHMKIFTSYFIIEMQTKMTYNHISIRMAKTWNIDNIICWQRYGETGILINWLLVEKQNGTTTLEDSLALSYKTKYSLTIRSRNHTPWNLPKGAGNSCLHKNLYSSPYRNLFITAKTSKQPWCPSVDGFINCNI